jgi:hypothetical protein
MPDEKPFIFGNRQQGGHDYSFGLTHADLAQHLYVVGKSGVGKSTFLTNLAIQLIEADQGLAYIDPHGDDSLELLAHLPRRLVEKTVYFNPADSGYPIGFNVLRGQASPQLVASTVVGALKSLWRESWGPRLEYILYAAVAALAECDNVSLLGLQRMLSDSRYLRWVVGQVKDPMVRSFWENEFANYERKFLQEAVAPIQNKVGQLLMSSTLRNILGQIRSTIDARFMMDDRRIFVANLSKGRLGEDKSNLLGALLVSQFQQGAMSRADVPKASRPPFHLIVDEFQSFTSHAFVTILSEARKYNLRLILAHQYLEQVDPDIRKAVFGNVGSLVSFRVGQSDADILEREYGLVFPASRFTQLDNHEVLIKLMINGRYAEPFHGKTLPPWFKRHERTETIILRSRQKYSTEQNIVEDRIRRWMGIGEL